jgi:tetratricopeptide (TPR) repeat protein
VCSGDEIEAYEVIELLAQLVEKSLVVADRRSGEYRYRLLETLRQYASQRLSTNGDPDQLKSQHASYFLSLAERAQPGLFSDDHKDWLGQLQAEADNFRAAIDWSRGNDVQTGLYLARAIWRMWWLSNQVSEGRSQMDRLWSAPLDDVPLELRLESLHARGNLAFRDGDYSEAHNLFEEMRQRSAEAGDLKHKAMADSALGGMLVEQMDYEPAAVLLRESLRLEDEVPDIPSNPFIRIDLGLIELGRGAHVEANRLFRESLARAESEGDPLRVAIARCCLGVAALGRGDPVEGRTHLEESLKLVIAEHFNWMIPVVIESFAGIAVHENLPVRAVRLASAAKKLREASGMPLAPLWQ